MRDLPRTIGFWGASAIMVGVVIGSGIFKTPPSIAKESGSPVFILSMWVVGGILSLFGALTYAELAVMYPQSGGVYVFLREGLGRAVAFVFGWTYMLLAKPLAAAGIAVIFSDQVLTLLGIFDDEFKITSRVITCVMLVSLTIVNVRGMKLGTGLAGLLTTFKILSLLMIVALALALWKGSAANFAAVASPKPWWLALAPIMAGVLWTYDGWSDVGSIAGEVRDPQKQLPRIYLVGTIMLIGIYLAVNAVYIWLVPLPEMAALRKDESIAPLVMNRLTGPTGGMLVTVIVLISTLGATHGSIITGARITFAQARDGLLFRFLGRVHPRYHTPAVSLWVQCALSCAAVWAYGFEDLAGGFVFTMWIFYGLAASVIFIMRWKRPDAERAYRCWGYPMVPALFILSAIAMTALSIRNDPRNTGLWLLVLATGFPVYYVWRMLFPRGEHIQSDD